MGKKGNKGYVTLCPGVRSKNILPRTYLILFDIGSSTVVV